MIAKVAHSGSNSLGEIFWFEQKKKTLDRVSWIHDSQRGKLKITSNYTQKILYNIDTQLITHWIPGINLTTYLMCNGIYPELSRIKDSITKLPYYDHTNFTAWNLIIEGNNIAMINGYDPRKKLNPIVCYNALIDLLTQSSLNQIAAFHNYLQKLKGFQKD